MEETVGLTGIVVCAQDINRYCNNKKRYHFWKCQTISYCMELIGCKCIWLLHIEYCFDYYGCDIYFKLAFIHVYLMFS